MLACEGALGWARILRILWPQAQRTAKMASPMRPFSGHLANLPSDCKRDADPLLPFLS